MPRSPATVPPDQRECFLHLFVRAIEEFQPVREVSRAFRTNPRSSERNHEPSPAQSGRFEISKVSIRSAPGHRSCANHSRRRFWWRIESSSSRRFSWAPSESPVRTIPSRSSRGLNFLLLTVAGRPNRSLTAPGQLPPRSNCRHDNFLDFRAERQRQRTALAKLIQPRLG